jgi:hypothetical protein
MILLFFRRIVIDAETNKASKFKFPFQIEIETQSPVLVLVVIGAAMVLYPLSKIDAATVVTVSGAVDPGNSSVTVLVIADPDYSHNYDAKTNFNFSLPLLNSNATYRVKFVADKHIIDDQPAVVQEGHVALREVSYTPKIADETSAIKPHKDITDEQLKKLGIIY